MTTAIFLAVSVQFADAAGRDGLGHGEHVVVEVAFGVVDGEGREALDDRGRGGK